jgi:hypothetical protein
VRREEMLECIRKVNRGETCIPPALVQKLAASVSGEALVFSTARPTAPARGVLLPAVQLRSAHAIDQSFGHGAILVVTIRVKLCDDKPRAIVR